MLNSDQGRLVVAHARLWINTPYRHQHAMLGEGVDCVGLIIAVGSAAEVLDISAEAWRPYRGYARTPNPTKMGRAMRQFLEPLDLPPMPAKLPPDGSVMWLGWREAMPMHLAILATDEHTGRRTMIHALEPAGACKEHGFSAEWPHRVQSWWSYPGLTSQEAA